MDFFLDGRVDVDACGLSGLEHSQLHRDLNRDLQHLFQTFCAHSFAPSTETRRVDGTFVLHLIKPTEELPIRIFNPPINDRFVTFIQGVLQIQQADHSSSRTAWPTFCRIALVDKIVELGPVDVRRQNHQRVVWIEDIFQSQIEQTILRIGAMRLHFLQAFGNLRIDCLQIIAR